MKWSQSVATVLCLLLVGVGASAVAQERAEEGRQGAESLTEHADPEVRAAALVALGRSGTADDRARLEEAKVADAPEERLAAGLGLMLAGDRQAAAFTAEQISENRQSYDALRRASAILGSGATATLVRALLAEPEPALRRDVYRFLASQSGELYGLLGAEIRQSEAEIRQMARQALVFAARAETLELATALLGDRDAELRREGLRLVEALQHRRDLRAQIVEILEGALQDRDSEVQEGAARQLAALGERSGVDVLVDRLGTQETSERIATARFLLQNSPRVQISAMRPILEGLDPDGDDAQEERELLYELAATSRDTDLTAELTGLFRSDIFEDRLVAAGALGRTGDSGAISLLTGGLFEGQSAIRLRSARSLGHLGDPEALGQLRRAVTSERDKEVRLAAIEAIGRIRDERSVQVLRFLVTDNDREIKAAVTDALEATGLPAASQGLEVLLRDRNLDIQWRAFLALLSINPEAAQRHINQALRNPPETFGNDLNPYTMTESARSAIYSRLFSHSGSRVRTVAAQHASIHRDVLLPAARQAVVDSSIHRDLRSELVHLLVAAGEEDDLARLDRVMRNFAGEPAATVAAWAIAERAGSAFEASFRGFIARDDSVAKAIAAYALIAMD